MKKIIGQNWFQDRVKWKEEAEKTITSIHEILGPNDDEEGKEKKRKKNIGHSV